MTVNELEKMSSFSRLGSKVGAGWKTRLAMGAICAGGVLAPLAYAGDSAMQMVSVLDETPALMMHSSQGYLGVTIHNIEPGQAGELKLRDARGVEIVMIDHDAPACKAGLRLHDVIVQVNGQAIENVEQLRRMLHDMPIGRTVNLAISRDGQTQNVSVQLGDRARLEQPLLNPYGAPEPEARPTVEAGFVPFNGQQDSRYGAGFLGSLPANPLYVGVIVDPVGAQLADYFGVKNGTGLLVKSVDDNSPAALAGMKAGDVVLRVNGRTMASQRDWLHAIHANRGKQVQVTVIRNRKEQTVTLWAGAAKTKG